MSALNTIRSCALSMAAVWLAGSVGIAQDKNKAEAAKPAETKPENPIATTPTGEKVVLELTEDGPMELVGESVAFDLLVHSMLDTDNGLGAQVSPADEALRSHLALPKDQGLVVTSLQGGGPAETAGLQKHDVILMLGGKAVSSVEALNKILKDAGEKPTAVLVLRAGKKLTIEVTPKPAGAAARLVTRLEADPGYWIGVSVGEVDETLRSQLRLPEKRGLVVTKVESDAPAAKAGILLHDVLMEFGGKSLSTVEDLSSQVKEIGEKPATMKLIRSRQQQTLQITPAKRLMDRVAVLSTRTARTRVLTDYLLADKVMRATIAPTKARDAREELAELNKEVRKLIERIEALDRTLKAAETKPAEEKKK
jgi:membrane-associated protease RseP (regulator of RpoE activity)